MRIRSAPSVAASPISPEYIPPGSHLQCAGAIRWLFTIIRACDISTSSIITLRAKLSSAVYCNRSCLWGLFVCGGLLPRYLEIACIDLHQTGSVGEGSDHLQLIKFWPSCAPGKGVCSGAKFFWLRLTTASAQSLRLS